MSAPELSPLLVWTPLAQLDADLLVVPVFEGDDFVDVPGLDASTGGDVGRAMASRELTAKPGEVFVTTVTHHWNVRRVALIGAGKRDLRRGFRRREVRRPPCRVRASRRYGDRGLKA